MTKFVAAGGGFLLAVLWFDLIFDVQVLRHRDHGSRLPESVLESISAYYRRVSGARPMNRLVAAVMLGTLVAAGLQTADGPTPRWVAAASLGLAGTAILIAVLHTFPSAARLGSRRDALETQTRLARAICRDHLICLAAIAALLTLQLGFAA